MKFQKGSIRRSLKYSLIDGLFTAMMIGVSENYLLPYAIALGASSSQVAFLSSIPMLAASLIQVRSASVTQSIGSRTKLINIVVFFHAASWLPILSIPYLMSSPALKAWAPYGLLAAAVLFMSFGAFAVPAWQSLMSDYIPLGKRGHYFGWRNRLQGILTVCVSISAGLLLHAFGKGTMMGFTVIFLFAMICRFSAWWCLTRMKEPYRHTSHDVYFSFIDFIRQIRRRNFGRFVLFVSAMNFAVSLSSPLLSVFLLRDLGFSYAAYMFVMTTGMLSGFLFQRLWGRFGDAAGNIRAVRWAGWGIALLPILWLVSRDLRYLFFVQLFAGCAWGGFTLLYTNFIIEATSPAKRIRCISYFNVVNSFSVVIGAGLGGLLMHRLPPLAGYSFLTLFLLSCVLRIVVMVFLSGRPREVRGRIVTGDEQHA